MFKHAILGSLLIPLSFVTAVPTPETAQKRWDNCLEDDKAQQILQTYISFFEKLDKQKAEDLLAPDFFYQSASLNFLIGKDVRLDLLSTNLTHTNHPYPHIEKSPSFCILLGTLHISVPSH